jgi:hypothetical protein
MSFEFRKSSYSGGESGTCVEVAVNVPTVRAIRDSKNPSGPALRLNVAAFTAFLHAVKAGQFDR